MVNGLFILTGSVESIAAKLTDIESHDLVKRSEVFIKFADVSKWADKHAATFKVTGDQADLEKLVKDKKIENSAISKVDNTLSI